MITYLKAGWHTRPGRLHLRADVMDGAIDTASMLYRNKVPPEALTRVALQVRRLTTFIQPVARITLGSGKFSARERFILGAKLRTYTDRQPALQCFVNDCFEHVHTVGELRALYLHIIHVSQMMQLLRLAKVSTRRKPAAATKPAKPAKSAPAGRRKATARKASEKPPAKKAVAKTKARPAKAGARPAKQKIAKRTPAARKKATRNASPNPRLH